MKLTSPLIWLCLLLLAWPDVSRGAEALIRVLVWDEQQPAQKEAYENFLGNAIADHLTKQPGLRVISANIEQPDKDLPATGGHKLQPAATCDLD